MWLMMNDLRHPTDCLHMSRTHCSVRWAVTLSGVNSIIALHGLPSLPAFQISCQISDMVEGAPHSTTCLISGMFIPIPNAELQIRQRMMDDNELYSFSTHSRSSAGKLT